MVRNLYINYEKNFMSKTKALNIICKNSVILPSFLKKTFKVYNGNCFVDVVVSKNMLYKKFGAFVFTRKKFVYKQKSKN